MINVTRLTIEDKAIKGYGHVEGVEREVLSIPFSPFVYGLNTINISTEALAEVIATLNRSLK